MFGIAEEMELSEKVYKFVKDLEGLIEMYTCSDGIHDSGQYSLHFNQLKNVLYDTSRAGQADYGELWKKQCEEAAKAHEMYYLSIDLRGLQVSIPSDSRKTDYILPEKIKDYFSQKMPGAKLSQPCRNVFRWEYDDPQEFKKILG